jgi:Arylsulfotransferase (ASST)
VLRHKKAAVILLILLATAAFAVWRWQPARANSKSTQPSLEEFQSLPYIQWSKEKTIGAKSGVTKYNRRLADFGYNVYTNDIDRAYLMDLAGKNLHTWYFGKKKKCEYAYLLSNAEMLGVCMGQGIWKVDADSKVIWKNRLFVHHDIEPMPDGTFLTIRREWHREYNSYQVIFDAIQRLSADGTLLESWSTYDHLKELQRYHQLTPLDTKTEAPSQRKYDYYHLNSVKLLPGNPLEKTDSRFRNGNLLICLRNVNLIAILDKNSKRIVWTYGTDNLDWPHMPYMLANGNILVFDNGLHRKLSRVLEINPVTKQIVWKYEPGPNVLYSGLQGSAQRLTNGNTLICESMRGHVFEVTRKGEIVWEFRNPEMRNEKRKTIYRFMRIPMLSVPKELLQ